MRYSYYSKFVLRLIFSSEKFVSEYKKSIFEIDFDQYDKLKLVIFDFDDTLTFHLGKLEKRTIELLERLKNKDFKIAVYSNCKEERNSELISVLKPLGIYNVNRSSKPDPIGYIEVMDHFRVRENETMMVGDRIGTDIFGAFLAKIEYRMLVKPFSQVFSGQKAKGHHYFVKSLEVWFYKLTRRI